MLFSKKHKSVFCQCFFLKSIKVFFANAFF
jgi:hypothetical protein